MSAEFKLILLLLRPGVGSADRPDVVSLVSQIDDWPEFCMLCQRHGLLALALKVVRLCFADDFPAEFNRSGQQLAFRNATSNLSLTRALLELLELFSQHSIAVLPFKGPLLGQQLYGDIGLRHFGDLDILIARGDVKQAVVLVAESGFVPEIDNVLSTIDQFSLQEDDLSFYRENDGCVLELHWDCAGCYLATPLTLSAVDVSGFVSLAGRGVQSLSDEDLLVYLCVHGAKHVWERLEWLYSVAVLLDKYPEMDWDLVWIKACDWQCQRMLLLGLHLAHEFFGVDLPRKMQALINRDQRIVVLEQQVRDVLFLGTPKTFGVKKDFRFSSFHLRVRDSTFDTLRYGLRLLFRPTIKEWQAWPLPGPLSFLYYGFRPLRLAFLWLRGKVQGGG
ncbi:MAG: nucleotidyltransferase family protein [Desulfobulbaceae bacterium]|jgi:hypothetical protein|nr:nucleotidyltransferase family protein [Desulfobulbaceae bacterium]